MNTEHFERLPLSRVRSREGFNPRTHFIEASLREMAESIRHQGVVQPITVRPDPDTEGHYIIVAGERRYRASVLAGAGDIPAVVRYMDDRAALQAAITENVQREDMSAAEEAQAARNLLDLYEGDRDEVMRRLGWNEKKLDSRLMLLHAAQPVLDALARREIKLGHAELLSTLPEKTQVGTLPKVIEGGVSVVELRERINGFARPLAQAAFDTAGCQGCAHNSETQASLFDSSIGGGKCSNRECWQAKTVSALEAKKHDLAERYAAVHLDTERRPDTHTIVLQRDVGREQMTACQGCRFFGALLDTTPGREGRITEDVCFNLSCHRDMVAAHKAAANEPPQESATGCPNAGTKPVTSGKAKAKPRTAELPKRVVERQDAFLRRTAGEVAAGDARLAKATAVYALFLDAGQPSDCERLVGVKLPPSYERHKAITALAALDETSLDRAMLKLSEHLYGRATTHQQEEMVRTAVTVLQVTETEIAGRFQLDADYLGAHTKAGIESLMRESGFAEWYDEQHREDKKTSFATLMKQKSGDLVKQILRSGFDFSGYVPASLAQRLRPRPSARD